MSEIPHDVRERLQRERDDAIQQLRDIGVSPELREESARSPAGSRPADEGDQAQASERQDLSFMRRERVALRINRLTAALQRLEEGTYGRCERCGDAIGAARLRALPEATACLRCQEETERSAA